MSVHKNERQAEQHLKKTRASSNIGFILITRDKINRKTHDVMASSGAVSPRLVGVFAQQQQISADPPRLQGGHQTRVPLSTGHSLLVMIFPFLYMTIKLETWNLHCNHRRVKEHQLLGAFKAEKLKEISRQKLGILHPGKTCDFFFVCTDT